MKIFLMFAAVLAVAGAMFVSAVPDCPDDTGGPTIFLPNPDDCSSYYQCSNGEAILKECPEDLHFNPRLNVCDWSWNAGCAAPCPLAPSYCEIIVVTPDRNYIDSVPGMINFND